MGNYSEQITNYLFVLNGGGLTRGSKVIGYYLVDIYTSLGI